MPELPEVEIIRRQLDDLSRGNVITDANVFFDGVIGHPDVDGFSAQIKGKRFEYADRHGKYLIIYLDDSLRLVFHLRMTGVISYTSKVLDTKAPHLRLSLLLASGEAICFFDQRKFGKVWLLQPGEDSRAGIHRLGPDWWKEATLSLFKDRLKGRGRAQIKNLLLDQSFLAGLGNIYVDESLYRSCIHPCSVVQSLSEEKLNLLFQAVQETLQEGIEFGGTTFRDYFNTRGERGAFQSRLQVYQQHGRMCANCNQQIEKITVGGRGTHFCPGCQPLHEI